MLAPESATNQGKQMKNLWICYEEVKKHKRLFYL